MTSICEFQELDPVRQGRRAITPTFDRLDDIFVEVLEAFVLGDFLFERRVQARILDGDPDVAARVSSNSMSSLVRKIAFLLVLPRPRNAIVRCWARQGM